MNRQRQSDVTWHLHRWQIFFTTWENTEIVTRAFGGDAERVATMSKAYLNGAHTIPGFACAAKHFPGNGQDFRDAHIANNVNYFDVENGMRLTDMFTVH